VDKNICSRRLIKQLSRALLRIKSAATTIRSLPY